MTAPSWIRFVKFHRDQNIQFRTQLPIGRVAPGEPMLE